jgi:hypothetical protein
MFTGMISFMFVRRRLTSAVAALALGLGLAPLAAADPPSRVARLNYVQGSVSFRPGGVEEWTPATVNYPLTIGGDLWVDQGAWAELHIGSTAIRLTPLYVPPYHNSPTYIRNVNVTNVNITNVNVTNVNYVNRRVPGAVTAVSHDVFLTARPVATATVMVSAQAATTAQVVGMTAPLAPRHESVFARGAVSGDSRRAARPPDQVLARSVVARVAPPPAPVPFEARRKALEAQPGRPLDPGALETLREKEPSKTLVIPAVRPAAPVRDAPEAKHALKPAREGLPAPKPVAVEGFVPTHCRARCRGRRPRKRRASPGRPLSRVSPAW